MSPPEMTSAFDALATRCHGDWRRLLRTRANVLVTLPRELFDAFGSATRDTFQQPVACVRGTGPSSLPPCKTLILVDLHRLAADDQRRLVAWLSDPANADSQVVSLTSESLIQRVDEGRFDAALFYRLNTIHLDLTLVRPIA